MTIGWFRGQVLTFVLCTSALCFSSCSKTEAVGEKSTAAADTVPIVPAIKVSRANLASDLA
jgi:hypothetical protein